MDKQTQVDGAVGSESEVIGAQAIVGGDFDLSRLRPGFALDQMFWLAEAYIAEQSALPHIDAEQALYYIARANKAWAEVKHEDVIYGGKGREEGQKVLARGLAWLTLLNGEMEFAGVKLVSPIGKLRSRFAPAASPAQAPTRSKAEQQAPSTTVHQTENPSPVSSTKTEGEE